jgi:CMP-N,N'-diacetyllegionaminic acid synthase
VKQREVLAIIPARGGSKRVPGKNLALFEGKPLLAHSIEDALGAKLVTRTVVTTDDPEIKKVALRSGAEVIDRPAELATDTATSESALTHVLSTLREREQYEPDLVVFLQCTSPARDPADIDEAIRTLDRQKADSLLSVARFDKYIWQPGPESASPINYDFRKRWRDQEFPPQYMENGSIYVFTPAILRENDNRLGGKIALFEMESSKAFQIDHAEDFTRRQAT